MQIDMHYYGTYAMARAAGLTNSAAQLIAQCAQFVDDAADQEHLHFEDGGAVYSEPTAHHSSQAVKQYISQTISKDDHIQREIWVPFHFLPGNKGDTFSERLQCQMNSDIAQKMVAKNLNFSNEPFGLHLIGISAHVYADTFSHYGFSGVSSRSNEVDSNSFIFHNANPDTLDYLAAKKEGFLSQVTAWTIRNFRSLVCDAVADATGALGHGSVMTYPDLPYLNWSFTYKESEETAHHNNPETFLLACQELHGMFRQFASRCAEDYRDPDAFVSFDTMKPTISDILVRQNGKTQRSQAWIDAVADGSLYGRQDVLHAYDGISWLAELADIKANPQNPSADMVSKHVYNYYQAARHHRTFVLRELLPNHNLVVA